MHDDEELRTRLLRERADRGRAQGAGQLLNELRPAMRRARRRRIAATTAAVTVGLTGLAGAAQVVRIDRDDAPNVASDRSVADLEPIAPVDDRNDEPPDSTAVPAAPLDGGSSLDDTRSDTDVDDPVTPSTDHDEIEPPPTAPQPTTTSDVGEPPAPSATVASTTATTAPVAAATTAPPPTSTTTTTTVATSTTIADQAQPERFDSACGWVLAVRLPTSVEVIEIHPEPGYDARLEDPDHGNVTVQFTGPGEDCELKISVTGSEQRDD